MAMVRRALLLAVVASVACGQIRRAEPDAGVEPVDGASVEPPEDAASGEDASSDAGASDAADDSAAPPACDGPCPPEPLATGLLQATSIAVDQNNVYFAIESNQGTVYQCPKTGCVGAPIELGSGYATAIALDAARVYWGDFSGGKLVACTIGGCANQPTTLAPNQTQIRGVSTDGVSLFWSTAGAIHSCAPGACTPTPIATGQGLVIDVAADQARVFWVSVAQKTVYACPAVGCATPLALGPGTHDVFAHGGKVYWVNGTTKNVVSCAATGCSGTPTTIGSSLSPSHPVTDGKHVYWRDDLLDEIYRCPVSGCAPGPELVATKQKGQPGGQMALDGLYLYWTTSSGVYRLRK